MASLALTEWRGRAAQRLDELEAAHAALPTVAGQGRSWAADQLDGQLFVALVGQFHVFVRGLHDEALEWLRAQGPLVRVLANHAAIDRALDRGNPDPRKLTRDFSRLGLNLIEAVEAHSDGAERVQRLRRAIQLRNGIAHDDSRKIEDAANAPAAYKALPTFASYRTHRQSLDGLTTDLDSLVARHLGSLATVEPPW